MRYLGVLFLGLMVFCETALASSAQTTGARLWQGMIDLTAKIGLAIGPRNEANDEIEEVDVDGQDEDVLVLDYELLIETLSKKPFLEQLAFSFDDTPHLWKSFPQEALQLGNFLQAQLKTYWEQQEDLKKEVKLEISDKANHIIQDGKTFLFLRTSQISQTYEKIIEEEPAEEDGLIILGDQKAPRQVAHFTYIGGKHPQTVLGRYLKEVLGPEKITLVFDPQATLLAGLSGAFGGDFKNGQLELTVGPTTLHEILTASGVQELKDHHILKHELGHYFLAKDLFVGKVPLLAGEISINEEDAQLFKAALASLTGNASFVLPSIKVEESYAYQLSAEVVRQHLLAKIKAIRAKKDALLSREDVEALITEFYSLKFYLDYAYQHIRAAFIVTDVLATLATEENFELSFYRHLITQEIGIGITLAMQPTAAYRDGLEFSLLYYFPAQILQHKVEDTPPSPGDYLSSVKLDERDFGQVQEFIRQQHEYLLKFGQTTETMQRIAAKLLDVLIDYDDLDFAQSTAGEFGQDWQEGLEKLDKLAEILTAYPPYFKVSQDAPGHAPAK